MVTGWGKRKYMELAMKETVSAILNALPPFFALAGSPLSPSKTAHNPEELLPTQKENGWTFVWDLKELWAPLVLNNTGISTATE